MSYDVCIMSVLYASSQNPNVHSHSTMYYWYSCLCLYLFVCYACIFLCMAKARSVFACLMTRLQKCFTHVAVFNEQQIAYRVFNFLFIFCLFWGWSIGFRFKMYYYNIRSHSLSSPRELCRTQRQSVIGNWNAWSYTGNYVRSTIGRYSFF